MLESNCIVLALHQNHTFKRETYYFVNNSYKLHLSKCLEQTTRGNMERTEVLRIDWKKVHQPLYDLLD